MHFAETALAGAWVIDFDRRTDDRGWFARGFCQREFGDHGIETDVRQVSISHSDVAGTVRGLHLQLPPATETKIVRCVSGAVFDVVVDLRPESPTFLHHVGVELTAENGRAIAVPPRCVHGFMSLADASDVMYLVTEFYTPSHEAGLCHDDPLLAIDWPRPAVSVSDKDRAWPPLAQQLDELTAKLTLAS